MDKQRYLEELAKAYRDELAGLAISNALIEKFGPDWSFRPFMQSMADLEEATARMLKPLVDRFGLPEPQMDEVEAEAHAIAAATESWESLMRFFETALPPIVGTFSAMRDACDPADYARIDFLVRHEQALLDLALAGGESERSATAEQIKALVEESRLLVS